MKAGPCIMIGVFATILGLWPPLSLICIASGVVYLYIGFRWLNEEFKEEIKTEDGDKDE